MFSQQIDSAVKTSVDDLESFKSVSTSTFKNRDSLIQLYWQYNQRFKMFKTFSKPEGSILDIGAGSGGLVFWKDYLLPHRKDLKMTGIDLQKGQFFDRYDRYEILNLDQKDLPFENNSFDFIQLSHLIEHIKDWKALLDQCNSILKKGGAMYIETPSLHTVNLPKKEHYVEKGFLCTTINFFDDNTHVLPVDLDEVGVYGDKIGLMTLEKGYCKSIYLEDILLSYGRDHKDAEVSQYGLWSKLFFSSYIVLQKI
jgi:ubiquinone/menaquinone biosynthesis C-methylase UbiE